jgi:hypothetical protein
VQLVVTRVRPPFTFADAADTADPDQFSLNDGRSWHMLPGAHHIIKRVLIPWLYECDGIL